jgi:thiamine-phosphate pyrophosphorylase
MRELLPQLYVVLDRPTADRHGVDLLDVFHGCAQAGAAFFQVRDKEASARDLVALSRRVREAAWHYPDVFVLINDRADVARIVGADGVHLPASGLPPDEVRLMLGRSAVIGCSVHDEAELAAAVEGGASFATVSPIYPTASKPGYGPALGPDVFTRYAALAPELPLYALGGMTPERSRACIARGAHGAAAMSSLIADPSLVADFPYETVV